MLSATLGRPLPIPNNTYYPTLKCRFNDFTSLAICPVCENDTVNLDRKFKNCSYSVQNGLFQTLDSRGRLTTNFLNASSAGIRGPLSTYPEFRSVATKADEGSIWTKTCSVAFAGYPSFDLLFKVEPRRWDPDSQSQLLHFKNTSRPTQRLSELPWMRNMSIEYTSMKQTSPRTISFVGSTRASWTTGWGRPEQVLGNGKTAVSACVFGLSSYAPRLEATKIICATTSSDPKTIEQLDTFGDMNANLSKCRLRLCAQRYRNISVGADGIVPSIVETSPLTAMSTSAAREIVAKDDFNNTYQLGGLLTYLHPWLKDEIESPAFGYLLNKHNPNSTRDWENLLERIAEIFTQIIQSPYNSNATRIHGEAYGPEIFVRVRWVWFIMPLSMVVASGFLLGIMIYRSRKTPYLYKNSILATLFHGLDGWETHELVSAQAFGRDTFRDMRDRSKGMMASLKRNDEGILKLKRE